MISKTVTVVSGLESRLAALFVQNASKFGSKITITIDDKTVNAKSIMGVISLGILDEQAVILAAEGDDEIEAVAELTKFLGEGRPE